MRGSGRVLVAQIGEQPATATNQLQQPAPRVMIVLVRAQMIGQHVDPLGQQRDLNLRRAGVGLVDSARSRSELLLQLVSAPCRRCLHYLRCSVPLNIRSNYTAVNDSTNCQSMRRKRVRSGQLP